MTFVKETKEVKFALKKYFHIFKRLIRKILR